MCKKRILVISNMYPSSKDPYYGTFVKVFYQYIENNADFSLKLIALYGRSQFRIIKLLKYILFYIKIIITLLANTYDLVYVHTISHTSIPLRIISKLKKIKLIFNIHGNDLLPKSKVTILLRNFSKPLLRNSIQIIVPSYYYKKVLINFDEDIPVDKIFVSPSGGIEKIFYSKHKEYNTEFHVGFVSRIDDGKGWETLLKSLEILKSRNIKFRASIYGRGEQSSELIKLIKNNGLSECVKYYGPKSHEELPKIYSSFDIFIFPSERQSESLGLVGLEAMASSTPVIGSNIGGIATYVENDINGYLFTVGDAIELADKISEYMKLDDQKKKLMQNNAYSTATKYESTFVNEQLLKKIKELIG